MGESKMKDQSEQDKELEKALRQIYRDIQIPDTLPSWERIQRRLNKMKTYSLRKKRVQVYTAVFGISLGLIIVFSLSRPAVYPEIEALLSDWKEEIVDFLL
ncbi:hypothetical protein QWJ34_17255 [Saccharibacillus sp. CPCC 101409]|uniref:hypothetical protein n=1 Tax=Saccharibacillus sp. CPCC 101409 TaxID=3058041 RepID=UPI002671E920|nr:hypothetical protein [Saccharibacillus sp. CPCC 101409]MDO3411516.1 hypothetical protein [Saccharibacillus sp. CPCC 101409]